MATSFSNLCPFVFYSETFQFYLQIWQIAVYVKISMFTVYYNHHNRCSFQSVFSFVQLFVQQSQYTHKQWETKSILRFLSNFQVLSSHFVNFQLDNIKSGFFSLCETKVSSIPEPQNHLTIVTILRVGWKKCETQQDEKQGWTPRGEWQSLAKKSQIFLVCRDKTTTIGSHLIRQT